MAAIDHEAVLLGLKDYVLTRRSHGQDALLQQIARLEVECRIPEGQEAFDSRPRPLGDSMVDPVEHLRLEERESTAVAPRRAAVA